MFCFCEALKSKLNCVNNLKTFVRFAAEASYLKISAKSFHILSDVGTFCEILYKTLQLVLNSKNVDTETILVLLRTVYQITTKQIFDVNEK